LYLRFVRFRAIAYGQMHGRIPKWHGTCTLRLERSFVCCQARVATVTPKRVQLVLPGVQSARFTDENLSIAMPRENLLSLLEDFARYGKDVAVVEKRGYRRETWTYAKLADLATNCALELRARDVRTGDRVLLWGTNSAEWMAAFWGCLLRGAVAVPMDDGATPEFAARVARDAGVTFLFTSRGKPALDPVFPSLILEDLADSSARRADNHQRYSSTDIYSDVPITRSHIAQILFTSGTTAEPRGVVLTHGNFLANLEPLERGIVPYRKYERWFHPLRFVSLVPLSHVFGQFMALFVPPLLGATIVFELSANPAEIIRTVKRERATSLIAVPRMLDLLHSEIQRELDSRRQTRWLTDAFEKSKGIKFLRRAWMFRRIHRRFGWKFWAFISGGAALSAETEEFFKRVGYAVVQGYGMTETASLISLNHPFRAAEGTIGKILPGREFRLAEDGEILIRGENVSSGYWENGALRGGSNENVSSASEKGKSGWLHTGDIGELDAQGNLRFRGRKKNVIVTPAGLNVYPEDLEAALRKQSGVRDCVVVPIERNGNTEPCAVILPSNPQSSDLKQAIEAANATLAEYQRIRISYPWPEADFPRTPTGKPRISIISAQAIEAIGTPSGSNQPNAQAENGDSTLNALLEKFSHSAEISGHLEKQLNLSSLDRVELMSAMEGKFHVELNETVFANAKTVKDLQHLLQQPSAQKKDYHYPRWAQRELIRWFRSAVYYALVWPATQILGHPKIVGLENLRDLRAPALIISNHITRRADIGLILASLPLRFRHRLAIAMGGESLQEMRKPPREWFFARRWSYQLGYWMVIALFNVFPLPQFSGFRESFRFAGESIDRGYSVLVFPEGAVNNSSDGHMAPFRSGIGMLAENLQVPIIPIRLDGVWRMKREHRRLAHLSEITVHVGVPVTFPAGTSPQEIASTLESIVLTL
jgi:long-chain acyl-CoA synthetase